MMDFQLDRLGFDSAPGHHEIKHLASSDLKGFPACPQCVRINLEVASVLVRKRAPICRITRRKRPNSRTVRRETALPLPPKPASAISAEAFKSPVREEDLDAGARHRVDIEHRRVLMPATFAHAAAPVGSERAKPRR